MHLLIKYELTNQYILIMNLRSTPNFVFLYSHCFYWFVCKVGQPNMKVTMLTVLLDG